MDIHHATSIADQETPDAQQHGDGHGLETTRSRCNASEVLGEIMMKKADVSICRAVL